MIWQQSIFSTLFLIIIVLSSYTASDFAVKNSQGAIIAQVEHGRTNPPIAIGETIEGALFVANEVMQISSSNEKTVKYELLPISVGVTGGYFLLENRPGRGIIRQLKGIDREKYPKLTLNTRALDASGNPSEPDVSIEIIIEDENDNSPIFVPASLIGNVLESAVVGETFMQLQATDADSSFNDYNKVRIRYDGNETSPKNNGSNCFTVNDSGQVSVVSSLNRETEERVTFLVVAFDGLPISESFRHSTSATVTINILDDNDNAPYFDPYPPAHTVVGELTKPGTVLFNVQASDFDEGVNKGVFFEISGGNVDDTFAIQSTPNFNSGPSTGKVLLQNPLDFESGLTSYSLIITACNREALQNRYTLKTSTTVRITVEDEDEPPIFLNEPYSASIPENITEGVPDFFKVTAKDYDFNGAQQVSYSLGNPLDWFEIDKITGYITAKSSLDREHVSVNQHTSQYLLKVIANDDGPNKLSSTATVTITIEDKNDNAPNKGDGWNPTICEKPSPAQRESVAYLHVQDDDSDRFKPFTFKKIEAEDWQWFALEGGRSSYHAQLVIPKEPEFNAVDKNEYLLPVLLVDTAADGQAARTSTETVTVTICRCSETYDLLCNTNTSPSIAVVVSAVAIAMLMLSIIVLPVVAYRRRNKTGFEKQARHDDDVREFLEPLHEKDGKKDDAMRQAVDERTALSSMDSVSAADTSRILKMRFSPGTDTVEIA